MIEIFVILVFFGIVIAGVYADIRISENQAYDNLRASILEADMDENDRVRLLGIINNL